MFVLETIVKRPGRRHSTGTIQTTTSSTTTASTTTVLSPEQETAIRDKKREREIAEFHAEEEAKYKEETEKEEEAEQKAMGPLERFLKVRLEASPGRKFLGMSKEEKTRPRSLDPSFNSRKLGERRVRMK